MSVARKCDRCGTFYEPFEHEMSVISGNNFPNGVLDLCPCCYDNIQRFLSEYKEAENGKSEEEQPE